MNRQNPKMVQTSRASFPFDIKTLNHQSTQLDSINDEVSRLPYNPNADMHELASVSSAGQTGEKFKTINLNNQNLTMTIKPVQKRNTSGFVMPGAGRSPEKEYTDKSPTASGRDGLPLLSKQATEENFVMSTQHSKAFLDFDLESHRE